LGSSRSQSAGRSATRRTALQTPDFGALALATHPGRCSTLQRLRTARLSAGRWPGRGH